MILSFHQKKAFFNQKLSGILAIVFFGLATYNSGFSTENKKPNSIVYIQNSDDKTAYYGTYNTVLDTYTKQIFNTDYSEGGLENADTKSKYNTRFKFAKKLVLKI